MKLKVGRLIIEWRRKTRYMKLKDGSRVPLVRIAKFPRVGDEDKWQRWFHCERR